MSPRRKDRWYSIEGQRRIHRSAMESSKGSRHLISLVVLLTLTLMAMQQVSNPKRVERVAAAVGLLPASSPASPVPTDSPKPENWQNISQTLVSSDPDIETQAQIVERLLDAASAGLVSSLAYEHLITKESTVPNGKPGEKELVERTQWLQSCRDQVIRWTELSDSTSREHANLSSLWKLLDQMSEPASEPDFDSQELRDSYAAFRLALERKLLTQFADNTPWRTSDRVPLMRATQRAVGIGEAIAGGDLPPETLPAIAVPQLMGDTDALRGRAIRISGRIALVDQKASMNVEDPRISQYGVLWLQPDDGSNQPMIIHVPDALAISPEEMKKDRWILVSGIVTKRRAYASNRGGEIAPVIIAAHIQPFTPGARIDHTGSSTARPAPTTQRWTPPVDIHGALERIEQRIGSRIEPLQARIAEGPLDKPETIDTLVRSELVQATLDGLYRTIEEVQLVANPKNPWRKASERRIRSCRGMVTQVRRIALDKEPFPGWQWPELYACAFEPSPEDQASTACVVVTQHVPSQWLRTESLPQPAIASGLAFDVPGTAAQTFLISPAVQWREAELPASASNRTRSPSLPSGWSSLLERGWNLSWIDTIEGLQGKPMTARESEAFYSLLRCSKQPVDTGSLNTSSLNTLSPDAGTSKRDQTLTVMQSIQRAESRKTKRDAPPQDVASSGYRIQGVAEVRRIQRVDVRNPAEQEWLGADHYYQLDGFADIGNSRITIRFEESDEPIIFEKEFPVTLVALKVPDSLLVDAGDAIPGEAQAWYPRSRVAVSGWFYRMWRFKTTQISEATNDKEAQQGPLLVVDRFDAAAPRAIASASNVSARWVGLTTMAIGILGGLWILHHVRQGMRQRSPKR